MAGCVISEKKKKAQAASCLDVLQTEQRRRNDIQMIPLEKKHSSFKTAIHYKRVEGGGGGGYRRYQISNRK